MSNTNVYLLIGENEASKLTKLNNLKKEILSANTADFNLETLSAKGLKPKTLQEAFLRMPFKSKKRLLIMRELESLPEDSGEKLISYLRKPHPQMMLILEAASLNKGTERIAPYARLMHFRKTKPYDAFALGDAIRNKNRARALDILSDLLLRGEKPQKIMGALIWKWEMMGRYLPKAKIDKGFDLLLEADLNIKSSRIKIETALELLVVKLTFLT